MMGNTRFATATAAATSGALLLLMVMSAGCGGGAPVPAERTTAAAAASAKAPASASADAAKAIEKIPPRQQSAKVEISDIYYLQSAADVQMTRDGSKVAFTVARSDRPGAPYTQIWVADVPSGSTAAAPAAAPIKEPSEGSAPRWSPDGKHLAFFGTTGEGKTGLVVADADGGNQTPIADTMGTNHPLPQVGERLAWSPDGKQIAYVSATPGPEPDMNGDPIVITRYWFRPATSWPARFNDNRRLHLFLADVASKQVKPLTQGVYYEHSIAWSPDGKTLAFLTNHEPDPDLKFNYDIYLMDVSGGASNGQITQLTHTKSNEFHPVWSPDGKTIAVQGLKRDLTSSETNMEDTHAWTIDVASGARKEVGAGLDNRQGAPEWSGDGKALFFTVQSRGNVTLHKLTLEGLRDEPITPDAAARGTVMSFAIGGPDDRIAYAMATPSAPPEVWLHAGTSAGAAADTPLSALNKDLLAGKTIATVEAVSFKTFDGKAEEAFLTKPIGAQPGATYPMIVMIHGGPHSQQGPTFTHKAQAYAARGWAALMVNYRGSTGYGQAFADAIARDQNGGEGKDVLAGVDAALAHDRQIDPNRLGVEGQSYGGQLTNWLVTQTGRFKAAVPAASISNLVSHNYMSVYHDYLEQEYFGKPHTGGIVDQLWQRSAIRIVNKVKTPVMFIHGDNDQLVNPAEIEQYFIALKDVGVETMMVRYPREGHGIREAKHLADVIDRSIAWYDTHFKTAAATAPSPHATQ